MHIELRRVPMRKYNPYMLQLLARELSERDFLKFVGLVIQRLEPGARYRRSDIEAIIRSVLPELGLNPSSVSTTMCKFYNDLRRLCIIRAGSVLQPWSASIEGEADRVIVSASRIFSDPELCGAIAILLAIYMLLSGKSDCDSPCIEMMAKIMAGQDISEIASVIMNKVERFSPQRERVEGCLARSIYLLEEARKVIRSAPKLLIPIELWAMVYD